MTGLYRATCTARRAIATIVAIAAISGIAATSQAQVIQTFLGTTDISNRLPREISITPKGLATAPDGSLYVVDQDHSQILRFDLVTQTFTVVAGTMAPGFSGDGGPATNAQLNVPGNIAFDAAGNLFIADSGNRRVRRVAAATGIITTVAGGGINYSENIPATARELSGSLAIAIAADQSLYITEQQGHRLLRVDAATGIATIVAGKGYGSSTGDGGPALWAGLSSPIDLAIDASNNIYIAEQYGNRLRVINAATGVIDKLVTRDSTGQEVSLPYPRALRFDYQGNLLVAQAVSFTDTDFQGIHKIDIQTLTVSTVVGGGTEFEGVPAIQGRIDGPHGLAVTANGDLYVSSEGMNLIQRVNASSGMIEVVAGNGWWHYNDDGTLLSKLQIAPSYGIASRLSGEFFVLDNWKVRAPRADGTIGTVAGNGAWGEFGEGGPAIDAFLGYPTVLALDPQGNLFVAGDGEHRIRKIDRNTGIIQHFAGSGYEYGGDGGPAISATMSGVRDLAIDSKGGVYLIDTYASRVRYIHPLTGMITTVAGNGLDSTQYGSPPEGIAATQTAFGILESIAIDGADNLYIGVDNRIRKVDRITGLITTVAGNGLRLDLGDGGLAIDASIRPSALVIDNAGSIFFTSMLSHRVRKIDGHTGIVTTVAGTGVAGYSGDGGLASLAQLIAPSHLALSPAGGLYITESYRVRYIEGIAQVSPAEDATPPIITFETAGSQINGWFTGDVVVTWNVSDPGSPITSSSGCEQVQVTTDTNQLVLTCTATSVGGTASVSTTIKRDTTPPIISIQSPANFAQFNSGTPFALQASAIDPNNGSISENVTWMVGGTVLGYGPSIMVALPYGHHIIHAVAKDSVNLEAYAAINVEVVPPPAICDARATNTNTEWIKRVQVGTQVFNSGASSGYSNYTNTVPPFNMTIEGNTSITLQPGYALAQPSESWAVWIDLNRDGVLSANEQLVSVATPGTLTRTIMIPAGTKPGLAKMRVAMRNGTPPANCGTFTRGEVEDYTVNLIAPVLNYCPTTGALSTTEWIAQTTIAGVVTTSGNNKGYRDFTQRAPISLVRGTNSFVLEPGFLATQNRERWMIWIDMNHDGVFSNQALVYDNPSTASTGPVTGSFIIPAGAKAGIARMRIVMSSVGNPGPCSSMYPGEVEDYTVSIP